MIYISSTNGVCYGDEDYDIVSTFLAGCMGFQLITARMALDIIDHFDRVA